MTRQMWVAVLGKLVAPLEPERATKALAAMLPMLSRYPDAAFSPESAQTICASGRILADGSEAPLNRVPTFGELECALGKWWRHQREMRELRAQPIAREALPAPAPAARDWTPEAAEHVRGVVAAFAAERSWNEPGRQRDEAAQVKPHRLSDGHLLAVYEAMAAQGNPGAAVRVRMIRARMAAAG